MEIDKELIYKGNGRPLKITNDDIPGIQQKAEDYLNSCGREQTKLPKVTEFYRLIGITREHGDRLQSLSKRFSYICKEIKSRQEQQLIDDSFYGGKEVNGGVGVFLLKAQHGYVETEHRVISFDKDAPLNIEIKAKYEPIKVVKGKTKLIEAIK